VSSDRSSRKPVLHPRFSNSTSSGSVASRSSQPNKSWTTHFMRLAECGRRFPGPEYCEVLRWIHETLQPSSYIEIGVFEGGSLSLALPATQSIGIDPNPQINRRLSPKTHLFRLTSNEFFAQCDLRTLVVGSHFSLAFIDGLHLFEQALMDFINLERSSGSGSIVLVHDSMPLDAETSGRKQKTMFYTGDVWKLLLCLSHYRTDLRIHTVRTAPSGLSMIGNLDSRSRVLPTQLDSILRRFRRLSFDYYEKHRHEFLNEIGNTRADVTAALSRLVGRGEVV
jgi:methyltransferase family protein